MHYWILFYASGFFHALWLCCLPAQALEITGLARPAKLPGTALMPSLELPVIHELNLRMDELDAEVLFRKEPQDRSSFAMSILAGWPPAARPGGGEGELHPQFSEEIPGGETGGWGQLAGQRKSSPSTPWPPIRHRCASGSPGIWLPRWGCPPRRSPYVRLIHQRPLPSACSCCSNGSPTPPSNARDWAPAACCSIRTTGFSAVIFPWPICRVCRSAGSISLPPPHGRRVMPR